MKKQRQLKTNRKLFVYLILTLITCGIYSIYFLYALKEDTNVACAEDGRVTKGILPMILLSIVTCGIYGAIWEVKLITRHHEYCVRNGIKDYASFGTYYLWSSLGALLCGIGPFIALHKYFKTVNKVMEHYIAKKTNPAPTAPTAPYGYNGQYGMQTSNVPAYPYNGYAPTYYAPQAPTAPRPTPPRKPF